MRIPTSCSLSLSDLKKNDPPWNGFISHLWRKIIGTQLLVKGDMDSFPGKLRWNPNSRGFGGKMIFRIPSVGDFSLPAQPLIFRGVFTRQLPLGFDFFGQSFNIHQLLGDFFEVCWSLAIETNMFYLKLIAIKKDRLIIRECLWFQKYRYGWFAWIIKSYTCHISPSNSTAPWPFPYQTPTFWKVEWGHHSSCIYISLAKGSHIP